MTAIYNALPAAGWYTDPERSSRYRWWDGFAWTEHVSEPQPAEPWLTHGVQPVIAPVGTYNWRLEAGNRG